MKHTFNIDIARKYGVNCAIVLDHFAHWIAYNKIRGVNLKEERHWTYNSISDLLQVFDYLTRDQIRYAIKKLVDSEVLVEGNFNKYAFDRTKWYAMKDEQVLFSLGVISGANSIDGKPQISEVASPDDLGTLPHTVGNNPKPIPTNYQLTNTTNYQLREKNALARSEKSGVVSRLILKDFQSMKESLQDAVTANEALAQQLTSTKKKCTLKDVNDLIDVFILNLMAKDESEKTRKDLRTHFANWARIQWGKDEWPLKKLNQNKHSETDKELIDKGYTNVVDLDEHSAALKKKFYGDEAS